MLLQLGLALLEQHGLGSVLLVLPTKKIDSLAQALGGGYNCYWTLALHRTATTRGRRTAGRITIAVAAIVVDSVVAIDLADSANFKCETQRPQAPP